jgi:hypothetical protein
MCRYGCISCLSKLALWHRAQSHQEEEESHLTSYMQPRASSGVVWTVTLKPPSVNRLCTLPAVRPSHVVSSHGLPSATLLYGHAAVGCASTHTRPCRCSRRAVLTDTAVRSPPQCEIQNAEVRTGRQCEIRVCFLWLHWRLRRCILRVLSMQTHRVLETPRVGGKQHLRRPRRSTTAGRREREEGKRGGPLVLSISRATGGQSQRHRSSAGCVACAAHCL